MNNSTHNPARDAYLALYQGEGLTPPTVPGELASALRALSASAFATRPLAWTLYDLNYFVDELLHPGPLAPYLAFGLAGHGLASQAVHCHVVTPHCAVFYQQRWGSALDRPEPARRRHDASLRTIDRLVSHTQALARAGHLPAGQRLVVVQSSFHGARWAWVDAAGPETVRWTSSRDAALVEALAALAPLQRAA